MRIPRRQWIELHEQSWMPRLWRTMFQQGLGRAQRLFGVYDLVGPEVRTWLDRLGVDDVLDLASGSGEMSVALWDQIAVDATGRRPTLHLSDLFPDRNAYERIARRHPDWVQPVLEPVDALEPPPGLPRARTLLSSLHHFPPDTVRRLLQNAVDSADGVLVLESTARTWRNMLQTLPLPLPAAIIMGTMLRPWSPWHAVWSLLIPVLPAIALFDGLVSNLRSYTVDELRAIVDSLDAPGYRWKIGTAPMPKSSCRVTYLVGWRDAPAGGAPGAEPLQPDSL